MTARIVGGLLLLGAVLVPPATAHVSVNVQVGAPPVFVLPAPPPLIVVPAAPVVMYAPSLQFDIFFYNHRWYRPHGSRWFVGTSYNGPWTAVVAERLPPVIVGIPVQYYKVPPGHLKHAKGGLPGYAQGKGRGHD